LASRNASFHEGVVTGALLAPLKLGFVLLLGLVGIVVVAWIVDWGFVFKVWPEGVGRLKGILAADLARGIELAEWQGEVPSAVTGTANFRVWAGVWGDGDPRHGDCGLRRGRRFPFRTPSCAIPIWRT
jgi:hypothetical protein